MPGKRSSVDERLAKYRKMRHFERTDEPRGTSTATDPPSGERRFVVQRHRATRLHYDFRLEMDGVLVSWAVPKGPTLDPSAKRLAVHVEDHPIEYFDFEGVIGKGEYGGGDVIVWDWGTWAPSDKHKDPIKAVAKGELHVDLTGEKIAGRFAFVRRGTQGDKEQWLLVHKHDDAAVDGWDAEEHPRSVKSGRTNDEVADDPDLRWHGDRPASEAAEPVADGDGDGSRSAGVKKATGRARTKARRKANPRRTRWGAAVARRRWTPPTADELEALDALGKGGVWAVDGVEVKLTNLDKVLFPGRDGEDPVTKGELVRYFAEVAPHALPYFVDRPVNLNRYPDGAGKQGFWNKSVPKNAPDWLTQWHYDDHGAGETEWYMMLDRPAALVYAVQLAGFEMHPWTSLGAEPQRPTWAYVDIDPGPASTFDDVVFLATLHRTALDHLGVVACPKVTGKRGIQVWIPVEPQYTFDETRQWVEALSKTIGRTVPDLVSWKWTKSDRGGKARLDYTQNAINKTLVAPFSVRPAPGAPVSVPITWDELDDPDLAPDRWTIRTVLDRLAEAGDPLADLVGLSQELPPLDVPGGMDGPSRRSAAPPPPTDPADDPRSKDELYAEAQRLDIPGRSRMGKAELAAALADA